MRTPYYMTGKRYQILHNMKNISIIIPTHNRKYILHNLLSHCSIQMSKLRNTVSNIVVIVDGSTDGTLEMLASYFPDVHVVQGNGVWWYTKSMNEGFRYALEHIYPDFFLTLNDDVVLADDYLEQIVKVMNVSDGNTVVGSLGVTASIPSRVITSGNSWRYQPLGIYSQHLPFLSEVVPDELTGLHPSLTLPGRGMLIPVEVLRALNLFDENFKQYHSDGDFTLRALQKGYCVKISWDAKIFVNHEKTSASTSFLNSNYLTLINSFSDPVSRNYLPAKARFIWRHGEKKYFFIRLILYMIIAFINVARTRTSKNEEHYVF